MQKKESVLKSLCKIVFIFSLLLVLSKEAKAAINYIPLNTDNSWISGQISNSDEVDYYVINIGSAGWLTVDYQGLSVRNSYIEIYNYELTNKYREENIGGSSDISPVNHTEVLTLEPGKYAVKIYSNGDNVGDYRVRATFKAANNNDSVNNNSFQTAQTLSLNQTVTGFLSEDDEIDFYKINVQDTKTVRIIQTKYTHCHLQIWDKDYINIEENTCQGVFGIPLCDCSEEMPSTYIYEEKLEPGTYYIKIYKGYNGRYSIRFEEKILAKKISISGNKVVTAGKSFTLKAKVTPSNTTDKTLKWESGDTWIADVDSETGKVTTHRAGKVNITVSAQDGSNTTKVISVVILPKKMNAPSGYKVSKKKAYIYWYSESGVSGYQVQYSKNKSLKNAKIKKVSKNATSTYISKLSKKKYYVRVRGYVKVGKKYYYGGWSKKKTINMKKNNF